MLASGRLLGGIATSLLFSAFESWLVAAHNTNGYPEAWLGDTFSKAVFAGAGVGNGWITGPYICVLNSEAMLGWLANHYRCVLHTFWKAVFAGAGVGNRG